MTEGPRVNFVMHEALFEIYTWILIFILYQNCPVLAMKYPFLNTQQPAHTSRMFLLGKMDVKIFLMFIVAENTGSVNISKSPLNVSDKEWLLIFREKSFQFKSTGLPRTRIWSKDRGDAHFPL